MRKRQRIIIGVVLLTTVACANPRHTATVAAVSVYTALAGLQDEEAKIYADQAPFVITLADHQTFNSNLAKALAAGKAYDQAIEAWPPSGDAPATLTETVKNLTNSVVALSNAIPPGPLHDRVQSTAINVSNIALTVIALRATK